MYKKQHKIIFIFSFILFFVFFFSGGIQKDFVFIQPALGTTNQTEGQITSISITIVVDDLTFDFYFNKGISLYEVLLNAQNNHQIEFIGRQYSGLGFFVTDIGSLHRGNGKNLLYYINDEKAKVGISSYVPKDGDIISWKLE